jgi:hypothetical protein
MSNITEVESVSIGETVKTTELVQLETDKEYYQGEVLCNTNVKHGDGVLVDKSLMLKYTGSFQNNQKHCDAGQLVSLSEANELVEYRGSFEKDRFHGMGILLMNDGFMYKGQFDRGYPTEGMCFYPNGDEFTGTLTKDRLRDGYGVLIYANSQE